MEAFVISRIIDDKQREMTSHSQFLTDMMQSYFQQQMDPSIPTTPSAEVGVTDIDACSDFRGTCQGRGSLPLKKRRLMMAAANATSTDCIGSNSDVLGSTCTPTTMADVRVDGIGAVCPSSLCTDSHLARSSNDEKIAALALVAAASAAATPMTSEVTDDERGMAPAPAIVMAPPSAVAMCTPDESYSNALYIPSTAGSHVIQDDMNGLGCVDQQQHVVSTQTRSLLDTPQKRQHEQTSAKENKRHRVHHPPLTEPLPNGCHGRTSRNNSYCRRHPCYNGSKYCKLHYQQYVLGGGGSSAAHASGTSSASVTASEQQSAVTGTAAASNPANNTVDESSVATTTEDNPSLITKNDSGPVAHAGPSAQSGSSTASANHSSHHHNHHHHQDKRFTGLPDETQCKATTTRGRPCAYVSVNGTKYCHLHADYDTNPPPRRGSGSANHHGGSGHGKRSAITAPKVESQGNTLKKNFPPLDSDITASNDAQGSASSSAADALETTIGPMHVPTVPLPSVSDPDVLSTPNLNVRHISSSSSSSVDPHELMLSVANHIDATFPPGYADMRPIAKPPDIVPPPLVTSSEIPAFQSSVEVSAAINSLVANDLVAIPPSEGQSTESQGLVEQPSSEGHSHPLLSSVSSDQWSNKRVLISTGPLVNHTGRVMKWGNGWVTVRTSTGSNDSEGLLHNRRAVELFLLPDEEGEKMVIKQEEETQFATDQISTLTVNEAGPDQMSKVSVKVEVADKISSQAVKLGMQTSNGLIQKGKSEKTSNKALKYEVGSLKNDASPNKKIDIVAPNAREELHEAVEGNSVENTCTLHRDEPPAPSDSESRSSGYSQEETVQSVNPPESTEIFDRTLATVKTIQDETQDKPSKDEPSKDGPSKDEPSKDGPSKDEPSKDEPSKDEQSKDEPSKDEPSKDEPSKGEPSKGEPSKDEPSIETEVGTLGKTEKEAAGVKARNFSIDTSSHLACSATEENKAQARLKTKNEITEEKDDKSASACSDSPLSSNPSSPQSPQRKKLKCSVDENSIPLVESLSLAREGRLAKKHNFDLLFGTAALERSRRTIHKPERYEDTAMIEKKRDRQHRNQHYGHSSESEAEGHCCQLGNSPSKKKRADHCHKGGKRVSSHDRHESGDLAPGTSRASSSGNKVGGDAGHNHISSSAHQDFPTHGKIRV